MVYIPTLGMMSRGFYRTIEPVAVLPVSDSEALQRAFASAIARGNPKVPILTGSEDPPSMLPSYAGVRNWKTFVRGASTWGIRDRNGIFQIIGYTKDPPNGWVEDRENVETFPSGTVPDQVIRRMIAILQQAAADRGS